MNKRAAAFVAALIVVLAVAGWLLIPGRSSDLGVNLGDAEQVALELDNLEDVLSPVCGCLVPYETA